jgi:uncharacterized lipoprotein YehR (DUF1307 family)
MKYILIALTLVLVLTGCGNSEEAKTQVEPRIKGKGVFHLYATYEIIEIDGVEYVATYNGGICPLVKDTTAKKIIFKINQ